MAGADQLLQRRRKSNFTAAETSALIANIRLHQDVLFGRLTQHVSHARREHAWQQILVAVNAVAAVKRTATEIKIKWKHIKQNAKHKIYSPPVNDRLSSSPASSAPRASSSAQSKPHRPNAVQATDPSPQAQSSDADKDPDEVCLRWNSHHSNMKNTFPSLLEKEQYVDVTLCSEGQMLRCHRLILSTCSPFFEEILSGITPLQHPVIFLKGTPFWILKSLIDFMYVGEVHIEQSKLNEILEVAELLKIKGLTGKSNNSSNDPPQPAAPATPKPEVKEEQQPRPAEVPALVPVSTSTPGVVKRAVPPLRLAVTKETMHTIDPYNLLKTSFLDENSTRKPLTFKNKTPADFKTKETMAKRFHSPKKRLKRKSVEHDTSPPPLILRKGTKSRPIVKAPKYYHMEYEDSKNMKSEDGEEDDEDEGPPPLEAEFDLGNVKAEPLDIEENDVSYDQLQTTGTIRFGDAATNEEPKVILNDGDKIKGKKKTDAVMDEDEEYEDEHEEEKKGEDDGRDMQIAAGEDPDDGKKTEEEDEED